MDGTDDRRHNFGVCFSSDDLVANGRVFNTVHCSKTYILRRNRTGDAMFRGRGRMYYVHVYTRTVVRDDAPPMIHRRRRLRHIHIIPTSRHGDVLGRLNLFVVHALWTVCVKSISIRLKCQVKFNVIVTRNVWLLTGLSYKYLHTENL